VGVTLAKRAGARIAVTGAGGASAAAGALLRAELDGVRVIDDAAALDDADMLVFVADAGDAVDAPRTAAFAEAARERGILVAALVTSADRRRGRSALLAALREAADMVVVVRDRGEVASVVAALR
jgi:hypothetical protein